MIIRQRALAVAAVAVLAAAACGGSDTGDETGPAPSADQAQADDASTEQGVPADSATTSGPTIVRFDTPDGETLEGALFGDGDIGIVLAHMRGRDKTTWYDFAENAVTSGYQVLAFDFRGYGGSTGEQDTDLDVDLIAAVEFLRSQGIKNTVVMGASMGATATVNVASRLDLSAAVSLSAPGNFLGLDAVGVGADIGEPLLLVAAANDQPYADAAVEIDSTAPATQLQIFAGNAHGTNLFGDYDAELTTLLLDFVSEWVG